MAEVVVNVRANTGEATQDINQLDNALNKTEQSADDLSASLEQQEARIKTLGGAINLVGGSVEILAGGLALSGALSEEQAEKFEAAAVGAIAFAEGTKRVFEGYKELSEGLKAYGGISGAATKATKFLNAAIKANPAVAIATALAALVVGIYAYITATDKATEAADRERNALIKLNEERLGSLSRDIALRKAQGASIEEISKLRREELKQQLELVTLQRQALQNEGGLSKGVRKNREEIEKTGQEQLRIKNELKILEIETEQAIKQRDETAKAQQEREAERLKTLQKEARNAKLEYEGMLQTIKQTQEEIIESLDILSSNNPLDEPLEQIEEFEEEFEDMVFFTEEQIKAFNEATAINEDQSLQARRDRLIAYYDDLIKQAEGNAHQVLQLEQAKNKSLVQFDKENLDSRSKLLKAFESDQGKALGDQLQAFSQLTSAFVEVVDDGTKEGFEASKKYKIAEVVTSSTQAAFQAFAAAQQFGPILGPILGAAQVAAITVAATRAIQDIQSSTFEGGSTTPGGVNAPSTPVFQQGQQTIGGATGTIIDRSGNEMVRAYVVTGDVTSGIEAEEQINRRRTFGPG